MGFGVLSFEDFDWWILNICFKQDYVYDYPCWQLGEEGPPNRWQLNAGDKRLADYTGPEAYGDMEEMDELLNQVSRYIWKNGKRPEEVYCPQALIKTIKRLRGSFTKQYYFYTIVPQERLPYNPEYMRKLNDFCVDIFETSGKKWFKDVWWVIESGKHRRNPNLHIHALIEFKSSKHFRRDMLRKWNKYIPEGQHNITWERAIDMKCIDKEEYFKDKLDYMTNSLKGTHENFTDLGLRGRYSSTDC